MAVIRTQEHGALLLLTHDDGSVTTLPRVSSHIFQGGNQPEDPTKPPPPPPGKTRFVWPFSLSLVTSEYGQRNGRLHAGIDFGKGIATQTTTPINAAADGRVKVAGWHSGYGMSVLLDHGRGLHTLYAHMTDGSIVVAVGQNVKQNQKLGRIGNTGRSYGNHLHYETHENGYRWASTSRNPRTFYKKYN